MWDVLNFPDNGQNIFWVGFMWSRRPAWGMSSASLPATETFFSYFLEHETTKMEI